MSQLSSLISTYLISVREDVISYLQTLENKIKISSIEDEEISKILFKPCKNLVILDISILEYSSTDFFSKLKKRKRPIICLIPPLVGEETKKIAEENFKYIIPFPLKQNLFFHYCEEIISFNMNDFENEKNEKYSNFTKIDSFFGCFLGNSKPVKLLRTKIEKVAKDNSTVLLTGETGTGKSTAAEIIHKLSSRHNFEMQSISISTVVESLANSTFFGTETGAYTDAISKAGVFKMADNSTLFLDEIGLASLTIQELLLNAIVTGNIKKVGSDVLEKVNVRIITATNEDIIKLIAENKIRKDFFYRISDNIIKFPTLRTRIEDIPYIIDAFSIIKEVFVTDNAINKLMDYNWPGNLRELEQCLKRAEKNCKNRKIYADDIDFGLFDS